MGAMGEYELSLRTRAIEARRRLDGRPKLEPRVLVVPAPVVEQPAPKATKKPKPVKKRAPPQRKNASTGDWTPERVQKMLAMWNDGFSASEIAKTLGDGLTRSAICGKVWRLRNPDEARTPSRDRKKLPKKANKPKSRSNVASAAPAAPKARTVVVALPVAGVSDEDLVKGWLAQHGEPRRFKRGDSADPLSLKSFLRDRGYELGYRWRGGGNMSLKRIGAHGAPKRMTLREVVAFVDRIRAEEGLQRISA